MSIDVRWTCPSCNAENYDEIHIQGDPPHKCTECGTESPQQRQYEEAMNQPGRPGYRIIRS